MGIILPTDWGTEEKYIKIKKLGKYDCSSCGKISAFYLCQIKRRPRVVISPAYSGKGNFAVVCARCKDGKTVSDEWAHMLIKRKTGNLIFEEETPDKKTVMPEQSSAESLFTANAPKRTCPRCGFVMAEGVKFCGKCGEQSNSSLNCPGCGRSVKAGIKFCGFCGTKIMAACPVCGEKAEEKQKFCGKCGTKLF